MGEKAPADDRVTFCRGSDARTASTSGEGAPRARSGGLKNCFRLLRHRPRQVRWLDGESEDRLFVRRSTRCTFRASSFFRSSGFDSKLGRPPLT